LPPLLEDLDELLDELLEDLPEDDPPDELLPEDELLLDELLTLELREVLPDPLVVYELLDLPEEYEVPVLVFDDLLVLVGLL